MISREGYSSHLSYTVEIPNLPAQISLSPSHWLCGHIYIWSDSKQKIPYSNLVLVTRFVLGQGSLFAYPVS